MHFAKCFFCIYQDDHEVFIFHPIGQGYWLSPILFNIVLEVLVKSEIHPKEEVKLFQFVDDMVLYVENSEGSPKSIRTKKQMQYIFRIQSKHKNQVHFFHQQSEKEIKKTILFAIASKRIKYLGINLTKEKKRWKIYTLKTTKHW